MEVFDSGSFTSQLLKFTPGTSYDIRIETKPDAGARYFLRPSGTGTPFAQIYESTNGTDTVFGFGAVVNTGVFGFDDLGFTPVFYEEIFKHLPGQGAWLLLEVVDNSLQTNVTSVVITPVTNAPPVAAMTGPPMPPRAFCSITRDTPLSTITPSQLHLELWRR